MSAITTDPAAAIPAPYRHALDLYRLLDAGAEIQTIEGMPRKIWTGHMTKMVTQTLGLSLPYYTKILTLLKAAGSIQQLQRGAVTTPSVWLLLQQPTIELFDAVALQGPLQTTARLRGQVQDQRVKDVNTRVNELEDRVALLEARVGNK